MAHCIWAEVTWIEYVYMHAHTYVGIHTTHRWRWRQDLHAWPPTFPRKIALRRLRGTTFQTVCPWTNPKPSYLSTALLQHTLFSHAVKEEEMLEMGWWGECFYWGNLWKTLHVNTR
jgi:hypothetical protein